MGHTLSAGALEATLESKVCLLEHDFAGATTAVARLRRSLSALPASEEKSARTWLYQTCSELGWFQVAPAENPMRSANLTLAYFKRHCAEVFG